VSHADKPAAGPLIAKGLPARPRVVRAQGTCRLCGRVLSALERIRGDVCDAMDCRRRAADEMTRAQRACDIDAARASAALAWDAPALATAPVVWLTHHAADFAPPLAADLADLRESLMALEDDAAEPPHTWAAEPVPGTPQAAIGGHLCALCRGRCCRLGLRGKAFLDAGPLRTWLAQQPGATWAEAVDHYLGFVGPEHLDKSCLFHGAQGCTLPRERRSDICNHFACDTLEQVRDSAAAAPQAAVIVGIVASHSMHSASAVSAQGRLALPDPRAGPQLP
jgi:hypothetical protein